MSDNLTAMLDMQQSVQQCAQDGDPITMQNNAHRITFMRWQFEAIIHELCEARDEMGWKPWGKNEDIHPEAMMRELVDAMCFFMNWMLALRPLMGFNNNAELADWFADAHNVKSMVNIQRLTSGTYDGFAEKCPKCGREKETATWEEEELKDLGGTFTRIERFLVCECGTVHDHQSLNEKGQQIG